MTNIGYVTDRTWLKAGVAVAAVGWGANQFAPLLLMYRTQIGLAAAQATFGMYAVGLIPGLLLGGPISDRHGRRRVVLTALVASVVASVLLAGGWLFVGRLVAGVASGAAFSAGAAWIKELSPVGAPRRITVAMTTGFALGPLVAGLLAAWAPAPEVVPYVPHLVLAAVSIPLVITTPETHVPATTSLRSHIPSRFWRVVVPLAPWVFGSASVALAYLPGLVSKSLVFSAIVTALTALAGILVQPLARKANNVIAMAVVVAGLLLAAAAAALSDSVVVVGAALVLGAGYGCCQVRGLVEVQQLARPDELAALTATYQAISYIGFAAPFLLAAAQPYVPPSLLLTVGALLAAATLAWIKEARHESRLRRG